MCGIKRNWLELRNEWKIEKSFWASLYFSFVSSFNCGRNPDKTRKDFQPATPTSNKLKIDINIGLRWLIAIITKSKKKTSEGDRKSHKSINTYPKKSILKQSIKNPGYKRVVSWPYSNSLNQNWSGIAQLKNVCSKSSIFSQTTKNQGYIEACYS